MSLCSLVELRLLRFSDEKQFVQFSEGKQLVRFRVGLMCNVTKFVLEMLSK